jgi:universal stress protein F
MTRSVLCAIDLSHTESEGKVLRTAARLADLDGAKLAVITVLPDYGMSIVGSYFRDGYSKQAAVDVQKALVAFGADTLGSAVNDRIQHIVAFGRAYEEILHAADKSDADLIVIGAAKPAIGDFLLGPNAARVVRHAHCSVHVVRPNGDA